MRRTLSWLVAGALVSGIGGASFADSEDSLTPWQYPPKMTIGNLYQVFNGNAESTAVNRILPSASQQTERDGSDSGGGGGGSFVSGDNTSTGLRDVVAHGSVKIELLS